MLATLKLIVTAFVVALTLNADAQPAGKVHRIGYLGSSDAITSRHLLEAFRQALSERGWVEGQNVIIEPRFAEGRHDRLPELAGELVRLKVDVIAAGSTPPALAARNATRTIPIVMTGVGDPIRVGLVASLARPGGNVTGVAFDVGLQVFAKGLAILKECVPRLRHVAILSNPANPGQGAVVRDVRAAAQSLGLQLQVVEVRGPEAFDGAFAAMVKDRAGALLVTTDPLLFLHRARLAELAIQHRLPSMYAVRESAEAGGLMSYGPNLVAAFRDAAVFVDKILKGAKPGDLPVEQPTKFEFVINLKAAKAVGISIPQSVLARADQLLE